MPTYEYSCKACDHGFETEQRITADPLKTCPKCHADQLIRLVGTGNFILKGSGWYSDLYSGSGSASSTPSAESTTPAPTPSAPTTPASSD